MRILYLHQYFKTPEEGGAIRSYYLSTALAKKGHDVEMITSHNKRAYEVKIIDGIRVHYLPINYDAKFSPTRRIVSFLRFIWQAYRLAIVLGKFDLCYASSTPLTIGWIALKLQRKKGLPFYFEVRDLWPQAPIEMGIIKTRLIKKWLYKFELKIYQHADRIIALSPGIRDYIEKKVDSNKIRIVTNMSDCEFFSPQLKSLEIEKKYKVQDHFVITYFGAIGPVNHVESLIDIAIECKKRGLHKVHFQIVGRGPQKQELRRLIRVHKLDNVNLYSYTNKKGIQEFLNVTDAVFTSFKKLNVLQSTSPNKFFDGLAAGKIQIINVDGWLRSLVESKRCGFYVDPDNPSDFTESIVPFLQQKTRILEFQRNSRKLAELYFSRETQTEKFLHAFDKEERMDLTASSVYTLTG